MNYLNLINVSTKYNWLWIHNCERRTGWPDWRVRRRAIDEGASWINSTLIHMAEDFFKVWSPNCVISQTIRRTTGRQGSANITMIKQVMMTNGWSIGLRFAAEPLSPIDSSWISISNCDSGMCSKREIRAITDLLSAGPVRAVRPLDQVD